MGRTGWTLYGLWLLLMILTPHARRLGGPNALYTLVSLAVIAQAGLALHLLRASWAGAAIARAVLLVVLLAWTAEFIGSHTGLPFGEYAYTENLQPQIGQVPVLIPFAWLMMLPAAWAVADVLVGRANLARFALVSGLALTAWDLFLDPQMVAWDLWRWAQPGGYFGIPWLNFGGWTLTAGLITAAVFARPRRPLPRAGLLTVYATTWLLETVGLGLLFRLPGPAVVGCVGMGLFVFLAWRKWPASADAGPVSPQ